MNTIKKMKKKYMRDDPFAKNTNLQGGGDAPPTLYPK